MMGGSVVDLVRGFFRRSGEVRGGPAILLYHRIATEVFDPWSLAVSPEHFAEQMEWLARNRTVLPLAEFARTHREGTLASDATAITFDDGYACNVQVAAPILEQLGLPATIFLPAEIVEQGRPFWWDELQTIVIDHPGEGTRLDEETIALGPRQEADRHWVPGAPPRTQRQRAFVTIWSRLRTRTSARLSSALVELRSDAESAPLDTLKRPMTIEEARSVGSLIQFGSHALTHRSLPTLSAADKAQEIRESKERCEAITGRTAECFAYPFGDADADCLDLVQSAGFHCACITGERFVGPTAHSYALPRIGVGDFGADRFAQRVGRA